MKFHRPLFYRYAVAFPGWRVGLNRYGWKVIGLGIVAGRYCYAVKWASARSRILRGEAHYRLVRR